MFLALAFYARLFAEAYPYNHPEEITNIPGFRQAIDDYIRAADKKSGEYLFIGRRRQDHGLGLQNANAPDALRLLRMRR